MGSLAGPIVLQATDPSTLVDLPVYVRGLAAFGLVFVLGAGFLWRYETLVDRSIRASSDRPLSSMGYGIAAHLTVLFFGSYTTSQLGLLAPSNHALASVGFFVAVAVLTVLAAVGFTVVGVAVAELVLNRGPWYGLFLGALTAGVIGLADPLFGLIVWVIVVSMGVGGPVRNWFTSSADVQSSP